jgi:hypothetical protein
MSKDDFFEKESGKKAKKAGKANKANKDKGAKEDSTKPSGGIAYTVNLYLAIGLVVAAFAVGFFVGGMVWPTSESTPPAEQTTSPTSAPPLTQEQINQGQMPPGHPQVQPGETTTPSETDTTAPSGQTTP